MLLEHVVAEHLRQVVDEMGQVAGAEQLQRAPVYPQHADARGAQGHELRVGAQVRADVRDAVRAPLVEQRPDLAVVLEPQRHGCQLEHVLEMLGVMPGRDLVVVGRGGAGRGRGGRGGVDGHALLPDRTIAAAADRTCQLRALWTPSGAFADGHAGTRCARRVPPPAFATPVPAKAPRGPRRQKTG